jgi:archaellum component FlaC
MSVEEQIRDIAREELKTLLNEIEEKLRSYFDEELDGFRKQLSEVSSRTEMIEKQLHEKVNILVKLRKYTLDQLMSEYNRLMDVIQPEKETPENTER